MKPIPARTRRLLLGAGLVIVLADLSAWYVATRHLRQGFAGFRARAEQAGWQITPATPATPFSPFAASLLLRHARITQPGGAGFSADRLRVALSVFHPRQLRLRAGGALGFTLPGRAAFAFQADALTASIDDAATPKSGRARLRAHAVRLPTTAGAVTIATGHADLNWGASRLELALTLDGVDLGAPVGSGPDDAQGRLSLGLSASPAWPAGPAAAAARAWRTQNGQVTLGFAKWDWGPVHATANGTLGLDPDLQPGMRLALHVPDAAGLLTSLAQTGVVSPSQALAATALLSLLGRGDANGGTTLPVRLKSGTLTLARIPVARIPALHWPAG